MLLAPEIAVIIFALAASASWGAGDFCGGLATRRIGVFNVVIVTHGCGLIIVLALALLRNEPVPPMERLGWGVAAGMVSGLALLSLYNALASGKMGIAAPITAILSAAFPVVAGAFFEGVPGTIQLVGFGIALVAVWMLAMPEGSIALPRGLGWALLAGLGIGLFLVLLDQAGTSSVFWPLVAARATSFLQMLIITRLRRIPFRIPRTLLPIMFLSGILDAGGNAFFILASQAGRLDVAAVLGSLYPATTTFLARIFLQERLNRLQVAGIIIALIAIAFISLPGR